MNPTQQCDSALIDKPMYRSIVYFFIAAIIVSCTSSTIYEKPKNLIPEDEMVALLVDLHLARYAEGKKNIFKDGKAKYTHLVYKKFGIDSLRYSESNLYYSSRLDDYKRIYSKVEVELRATKKVYDSIKFHRDSLAKTKIKVLDPKTRKLKTSSSDLQVTQTLNDPESELVKE